MKNQINIFCFTNTTKEKLQKFFRIVGNEVNIFSYTDLGDYVQTTNVKNIVIFERLLKINIDIYNPDIIDCYIKYYNSLIMNDNIVLVNNSNILDCLNSVVLEEDINKNNNVFDYSGISVIDIVIEALIVWQYNLQELYNYYSQNSYNNISLELKPISEYIEELQAINDKNNYYDKVIKELIKYNIEIIQECCVSNTKEIGAVERVKKHLSYILGDCFLNNFNLKNILFLPFRLYISYRAYLLLKTQYSFCKKALHEYQDYEEAIRVQNYLRYKLGMVMVHNSKSVLGIISIPYKLIKEYKIHKKSKG